jgi:hypothetical protein
MIWLAGVTLVLLYHTDNDRFRRRRYRYVRRRLVVAREAGALRSVTDSGPVAHSNVFQSRSGRDSRENYSSSAQMWSCHTHRRPMIFVWIVVVVKCFLKLWINYRYVKICSVL